MFLGIDLGTSSVKAVLADAEDRVIGHATVPLSVERPQPLWSEQELRLRHFHAELSLQ